MIVFRVWMIAAEQRKHLDRVVRSFRAVVTTKNIRSFRKIPISRREMVPVRTHHEKSNYPKVVTVVHTLVGETRRDFLLVLLRDLESSRARFSLVKRALDRSGGIECE